MLMKNSLLSMSTLSLIFVDLGAMQVHFYVVTLVLDVAVLFCAVFPNGFVVVVVEVGDVEVVVPFLLLDVVDFVQDVPSMRCKYLLMIDLLLFFLLLLVSTVKSHCFALFLLSSLLRSIFGGCRS